MANIFSLCFERATTPDSHIVIVVIVVVVVVVIVVVIVAIVIVVVIVVVILVLHSRGEQDHRSDQSFPKQSLHSGKI